MAADTTTALLGLLLQGTGNNNNTWGDLLNAQVIQLLEDAVAGRQAIATTGGTTVLSAAQNRAAILDVTGSLGSNAVLQVSNLSHKWIIRNGCTLGAFTLTVKTASGAAATVPAGTNVVWCDGANALHVFGSSIDLGNLTSGTFSATLKGPDGTKTLPAFTTTSDLDTGWWRQGNGTWRYSANNTDIFELGPNGPKLLATPLLDSAGGIATVPVGTILDFAGSTEPAGYLLCFGQAVSRTTYAALFAVIGITYGVGDASTTFNLPDLRGRGSAGKDNMGGSAASRLTSTYFGTSAAALGAVGGAESHMLITAEIPAHTHTFSGTTSSDGLHRHIVADAVLGGSIGGGGHRNYTGSTPGYSEFDGAHTHTFSGATASSGGDSGHKNVQPTLITNKIIKH